MSPIVKLSAIFRGPSMVSTCIMCVACDQTGTSALEISDLKGPWLQEHLQHDSRGNPNLAHPLAPLFLTAPARTLKRVRILLHGDIQHLSRPATPTAASHPPKTVPSLSIRPSQAPTPVVSRGGGRGLRLTKSVETSNHERRKERKIVGRNNDEDDEKIGRVSPIHE